MRRPVLASKVPEITVLFWVTKVLTTGMGETTSDFVVTTIEPVVGVAIAFVLLVAALLLQFRTRRYVPWVYWLAVVLVSVFGTMTADVVHVQFGVPYEVSTTVFAIALAVVFLLWWRTERTLSIHAIITPRREAFYWATVLTTFALGTAAGDWAAHVLGLGYLGSGFLFLVAICIPAVAYAFLDANKVATFWIAYILTRPLGASFADWLGVGPDRGGIGIGTGIVSLVLAIAIAGCVAALSRRQTRPRAALPIV
ncbi:putative membrane-anchored protein [Microbacterium endophyticum]|uniref:Putative membrane-anchored protein n=1 Tax=Microbacterium endophyticum TaxID=1526412 RepID=A0A7W4V1X2_9MICO|nr:hypothetical protein [Microbacterium endophyticum]MBB2975224.1 putative membrane-anchored protein [Microbacterium endophyticum]NIK37564.1 putative membrane-anchored protein [Microbacterium endophyticum]